MAKTPNSTNDRFSNPSQEGVRTHEQHGGVPNAPLPGQPQPGNPSASPGIPHMTPGATYAPPGLPYTNPNPQHATPTGSYNPYTGTPQAGPQHTSYAGPETALPNPRGPETPSNPNLTDQAKDVAGEVADQAKQAVSHVADLAKDEVNSRLSDQKHRAAESLGTVAEALRMTGVQLGVRQEPAIGQYVNMAADQVARVSDYLQNKDVGDIVGEVERFARRQPALFVGGAVLLGILGARFLKSTSEPKPLTRIPTPRPAPRPTPRPAYAAPVARGPLGAPTYTDPGPRPTTLYPPTGTTGPERR